MSNGRLKTASFGPTFLGGILLFCAFALVAWILFRFAAPTQTYEEKRAQERRDKAAAIAQEAQTKLYGPAKWIDKSKGTVQLPIDTAMDLVVNDYQSKQPAASQVKVDDPYPYGLGSITPGEGKTPAAPAVAKPTPMGPPEPAGSLPPPAPANNMAPSAAPAPAPASAPAPVSAAPAPAPAAPAPVSAAPSAAPAAAATPQVPGRSGPDATPVILASPTPAMTPSPASNSTPATSGTEVKQ